MKIEIDQSIRIEEPGDTYLAFANGKCFTICIPFPVKQACFTMLYDRRKTRRQAKLLLFAACLYILLKPYLSSISTIVIDNEYDGHGFDIRGFLYEYIRRDGYNFPIKHISIASIGKKSRAHEYAWGAQAGKKAIDKRISFEELHEVLA